MARYCPHCHRQYDVTLFQFGHEIICPCGALLRDEPPKPESSRKKPVVIQIKMTEERIRRARMRRLQRMADRLCYLIINSDYPRVDLEIEREKVRTLCEDLFPDRMDLYEMVYSARFDRLWEQFRSSR